MTGASNNSLNSIADLIADGWAVVPVLRAEKRPRDTEWLKRVYSAEDFTADLNVGVKVGHASGHRIDVDCDAPEAVQAANALLPHTRTHGRTTRPRSHYWYTVPKARSERFQDLDGTMLIEIRAERAQTVVPPSVHESGDVIEWENNLPFLPLSVDELRAAVLRTAVATLLARHWPTGSRHAAAGHLGGLLARLGEEMIGPIVRTAATIAKDEEVEDRVRFAVETAERHKAGGKVTGGPSTAEAFSPALVQRLLKWYGKEGEDAIDTLNKRFFVCELGNDVAVGEDTDLHTPIRFRTFQNFKDLHCNQFVGKAPLGKFWLEHRNRRTYNRVVFAPPPKAADPKDKNLWRGFVCESAANDSAIQWYLHHTHQVIANGDDAVFHYCIDFLADVVQKPGQRVGKALALRGEQGIGKSVWVESFGKLFGSHFMAIGSRNLLTGEKNAHLSGKIVVFADEAVWGGRKEDVGVLKRLVTQDTTPIRRLYFDAYDEPNYVHLILATNEDWTWPAGNRERRGVILDVVRRMDHAYFERLWAEVEAPGFQPALLAYLQQREIDYTKLRAGLFTAALRDQQDYSADPVQQWWKQTLEDGDVPKEVALKALYAKFVEDMGHKGAGVSYRGGRILFIKKLLKLLPPSATIKLVRFEGGRVRGLAFPSLGKCREKYDEIVGGKSDWPAIEPEQAALTEVEV